VVATAANGYLTATNYTLVVSVGDAAGTSIIGYIVGSFSIENRSAVRPTTVARELDINANGEAGLDLGNVSGTLGNANVGWVDGSNRVDVGQIIGTAPTLTSTNIDVNIASTDNIALSAQQKLDVNTEADTALTDYDAPTKAEMDTTVGFENDAAAVGDPSTSESVMQYVKQIVNLLAGTTGIVTMPSGLDPANGVNLFEMLRAAMGSTFATATDSLEQLQADHVTLQSDTDDLQTQIGTAGAGLSDLGGMSTGMKAEVQTEVDSSVGGGTGTALTSIPWNSSWDAEVESEVNDAIDTVISELGVAQPATTPTLRTGLMLLYMALRNKTITQTSGTDALEVHNDAGTKITQKLLTDDGSDYEEAKMG